MKKQAKNKKESGKSIQKKKTTKKVLKKPTLKKREIIQPNKKLLNAKEKIKLHEKSLELYNECIKKGIPVTMDEFGELKFDYTKVNIRITYNEDGTQEARVSVRDTNYEEFISTYRTFYDYMIKVKEYIRECEQNYFLENPIFEDIANAGISTGETDHLTMMSESTDVFINFLEKYQFLFNAFENGKIKFLNQTD